MSASLFLSGVAASFGARPLFAGLDLTLAPGDVTALVGPNGSGKTTLLRIVAGEHAPDAGTIRLAPPGASIGYLPQSPPSAEESILGYARRRTGVGPAQDAFEEAAGQLATSGEHADERYARALEVWLALGGADLEVRLAEVLARLDLDAALDRPVGTLSGGQAARAGLASVLVSRYDLLLLDEPTNNLDRDGLDALTDFVERSGSPVLIASHDRAFLDAVATSVLELDLRQQAVHLYAGGWTEYRAARELARAQAREAYESYATQRTELVEQARRKTEWAREGRAKSARLGPGHKLEKKYREDRARRMDQRAARVRDAVERLPEVEEPRREWELRYSIGEAPASAGVVLTLDRVVAHNGEFRLGPVSAQVARGDRVALVGANGTGKSTLLEAVLGVRPPSSGRVSWGTRTAVGTIDQGRTLVSGEGTLLEVVSGALREARGPAGPTPGPGAAAARGGAVAARGPASTQGPAGGDLAATRTLLAKFGLGAEHIGRPCDTLSLGERTRAALAVLQGRAVNVVVLDEPTNHLDAAAIEQLEAALTAFTGTLLIVTHDRALLAALSPSATWKFHRTGDVGTVIVHDGTT